MAKAAPKSEATAATSKTDVTASTVHLVWGSDEFLMNAHARKLIDKLCPQDQQALGMEVIDGDCDTIDEAVAAIRKCIGAVQTVGFFGATKVTWLRDASFFNDGEPGKFDDVKEQVAALTEEIKGGLLKGQYLVISAENVHRGKAFYKACQAAGQVHEFNVPEKSREAEGHAREVATAAFAAAKLTIAPNILQAFLDRSGADSRQITKEIEKLDVSLGARRQVSADDVRLLVSPSREAVAWDLADAFARRDLRGAVHLLRQLVAQKENPIGMMAGLESRVRDLIVLRECLDRRWVRIGGGDWRKTAEWSVPPEGEALLSSLANDPRKQHPYRVMLLTEQASKFSVAELLVFQREIVAAHEAMVSVDVADDSLMEVLLVRLLGGKRRAA